MRVHDIDCDMGDDCTFGAEEYRFSIQNPGGEGVMVANTFTEAVKQRELLQHLRGVGANYSIVDRETGKVVTRTEAKRLLDEEQ